LSCVGGLEDLLPPETIRQAYACPKARRRSAERVVFRQQHAGPREGETDFRWAVRAGWENLARSLNGLSAEETMADLIMLQRAGLARETTGSFWDYSGGILVMTPVFRRLMTCLIETPVLGRPQ